MTALTLTALDDELSIVRLSPRAPVPEWTNADAEFISITRTADELSIVCPTRLVPDASRQEAGWSALKVHGPLDFGAVGLLAGLSGTLATAGLSIFAVSTYDTDYVLVKRESLAPAIDALRGAGHRVNAA